jgi:hypothetical protein
MYGVFCFLINVYQPVSAGHGRAGFTLCVPPALILEDCARETDRQTEKLGGSERQNTYYNYYYLLLLLLLPPPPPPLLLLPLLYYYYYYYYSGGDKSYCCDGSRTVSRLSFWQRYSGK